MADPTDPPDWVTKHQGKAKTDFNKAARGDDGGGPPGGPGGGGGGGGNIPPPPKPAPQRRLEMPGPIGNASRREAAQYQAARRSEMIHAERQGAAERGSVGPPKHPVPDRRPATEQIKAERTNTMDRGKSPDGPKAAGKTTRDFNDAAKDKQK